MDWRFQAVLQGRRRVSMRIPMCVVAWMISMLCIHGGVRCSILEISVFFYLREGAYPVLLLEAVCRLPTIFFEVPFNCINRGEKRVELCLPGIGPTNVDVAAGPVMLSKDEVVALSQNEKLKGFDVQVWSDVGYRLGDSIYLIDTHVTQENLSLFGVAFSSPSAVVWRIDPITGEREVLVSFDRGKIIVEDPPRKVVSRYE